MNDCEICNRPAGACFCDYYRTVLVAVAIAVTLLALAAAYT